MCLNSFEFTYRVQTAQMIADFPCAMKNRAFLMWLVEMSCACHQIPHAMRAYDIHAASCFVGVWAQGIIWS